MVAETLLQLYEITFLMGTPVVRSDKELPESSDIVVIADQILIMAVTSIVFCVFLNMLSVWPKQRVFVWDSCLGMCVSMCTHCIYSVVRVCVKQYGSRSVLPKTGLTVLCVA